jgi:arsenite oxidase large subunit
MLFDNQKRGDLVSDHVDPSTTIPYYKGVWASVRRIAPQPDIVKRLSFRPQNVAQ